jgi:tRNA (guanosine-2'-O-)-methyltransferase
MRQAAAQRCGAVHLAFENVVQNDNVESALRTAECAGIHHVHLIRGPQALASKRGGSLKRVDNALSKGAERWLQLYYHRDTAAFVQALRSAGFQLFGADVDTSARAIADCGFGQPSGSAPVSTGRDCGCAVIFGNERDGMSPELRAACDDLFFLPSVGLTQSYNVFVSAAMAVHHLQMRSIVTPDRNGAQQQVSPHIHANA